MRVTISQIKEMKRKGERIPMLTCYEYTMARIFDGLGVPMLLVGDSLGMVVLGYETTVPVTLDEMLHHTAAVARGAKRALIVGDMPFMTYHTSPADALRNAARMLQEGGAQAVKLEGGIVVAETVRRLTDAGIPVMGHIGLTPQSVNQLGGYRVQGRSVPAARRLIEDARALEQAGVFCMVLETVPAALAKAITGLVHVPTIGIGAGPDCDGQVQVTYDLLGLFDDFVPKHAKRYARLAEEIRTAVSAYVGEVRDGAFPTGEHGFTMDAAALEAALEHVGTQPNGEARETVEAR
ncbi:MAG: 3-methyl-2-oxobutanoate hydroxymethyltransferase [Chloroflexi bacterium]|nr:3-methyl-2-oxobutanoate hydroxymethyltransferase [Chloroflexota bacterium]